mmetsp:Transcript_35573/g.69109  ORF Transcript_35573/g.69109 Transcript_35573/m.69109 type:complete len:87 (+) Transcript_35573:105-365(+)
MDGYQLKIAKGTLKGYAKGIKKSLENPTIGTCLPPSVQQEVIRNANAEIEFADKAGTDKPEVYHSRRNSLKDFYFKKIHEAAFESS